MIILNTYDTGYNFGGKGKNLFRLKALGFNVPDFVVVPAEVSLEIISKGSDPVKALLDFEIPEDAIQQITSFLPDTEFFSVRSSASDEDGSQHSFAGQFDSFLFVSSTQLAEKIKRVWLSAYSDRVTEYRKNNGLSQGNGIAVIIQKMINADVSGVGFGLNPVSGNRKEQVISALYGLGEGLVSGELNADTYTVSGSGVISSQISTKTGKICFDTVSNSGTVQLSVEKPLQESSCLNDSQLREIRYTLIKLFDHYKSYQDIEFAYHNDTLYLLQARPVTSVKELADSGGEHIIWDNSNIIESYPGVTTPLTFSFILPVYEAVYRQFVAMMGVSQKEIDENKDVFANMLGLINGRVYYNLLSWYRALALLPGYSINAELMEKMMGVKERFELKDLKQRSRFSERLRVLNMIRLLLKNFRQLPGMRENFTKDFNEKMNQFSAIDFRNKNANELVNLYSDFEQTLLKKWKAPLVNDFFAMIFFGVLQKLVVKYKIDSDNTVQNDLMCGARDIISTEPMHRCIRIAHLIQEDAQAKKLILESAEAFYKAYSEQLISKNIATPIDDYIEKFGNRCVGELKLETITYKQNPLAFIRLIRSYVEQGIVENCFSGNLDTELRASAEKKVSSALKGKPVRKFLFNYFLKRARVLVSSRENLRYERTRAFGVVREIFCSIGDKFHAESLIEAPRDIFYLTKEEIFSYIRGTSVNYDLKALILLRKTQFTDFEKVATAERIDTRGIVYRGNDFFNVRSAGLSDGDLKGLGCCPGIVRAKVQVVRDPSEVKNLNGDILVTSSTDPGWVTLFPTASGILVERGSLLSHSAIVSREMGKPCIVGITGLLQTLKSGDEVEMDGSSGMVRLISKQHEQ